MIIPFHLLAFSLLGSVTIFTIGCAGKPGTVQIQGLSDAKQWAAMSTETEAMADVGGSETVDVDDGSERAYRSDDVGNATRLMMDA